MVDIEKILKKAIVRYGYADQTVKCMEEMGELTQALAKELIAPSATEKLKARAHIVEEISDVEIMLDQIKLMHDIKKDEVEKTKEFKLVRLNARIDDGD